jgi:hypothetical protein
MHLFREAGEVYVVDNGAVAERALRWRAIEA